jgi:hypothetical protein
MAKSSYFNGQVYSDFGETLKQKLRQKSLNLRAVIAEFVGMTFFVFIGCGTAVSFSSRRPSSFAAGAGADAKQVEATTSANLLLLEKDLGGIVQINASFGVITALGECARIGSSPCLLTYEQSFAPPPHAYMAALE